MASIRLGLQHLYVLSCSTDLLSLKLSLENTASAVEYGNALPVPTRSRSPILGYAENVHGGQLALRSKVERVWPDVPGPTVFCCP